MLVKGKKRIESSLIYCEIYYCVIYEFDENFLENHIGYVY